MKNSCRKFAPMGAVVIVALLASTSPLLAQCGGCSSMGSGHQGHAQAAADTQGGHKGHAQSAAAPQGGQQSTTQAKAGTPVQTLMEPIPAVLDNYMKIEAALAADSIDGVAESAQAAVKLIAADTMKMLPANAGSQAETVAKAKDLATARSAFKAWSDSLIGYLKTQNAKTGQYFAMYCPMAKAGWLQKDQEVKNPYYGSSMLTCGKVTAAL